MPRPHPQDQALFREVDLVLTEIKSCYTDLYNFWTEEISRAMEAFEKRRVGRTDFERWRSVHGSLKQTIESWKVQCDFYSASRAAQYRLIKTTLFRTSYPVVMLILYSATKHGYLRYAGLISTLGFLRIDSVRAETRHRDNSILVVIRNEFDHICAGAPPLEQLVEI